MTGAGGRRGAAMKIDPLSIRPMEVQSVPRISLREPEAAKALGVSESWLRREAGLGHVPSVKISGNRLYPVAALVQWLAKQAAQCQGDGDEGGER